MKKTISAILAVILIISAAQFVVLVANNTVSAAPEALNLSEIVVAVNGDTSGKLASGTVVSSVLASNDTTAEKEIMLVTALYLNGRLVALKTDGTSIASTASATLTTTHTITGSALGYELRNMVWDSAASMQPYTERVVNTIHGRVVPGVPVKPVHESAPIGDIRPTITRVMMEIGSNDMYVNNVKTTAVMPYKNAGVVRVSYKALTPLGAAADWNGVSGELTLTKDGVITKLKVADTTAYINGKPVTLEHRMESSGGDAMIPLDFAAQCVSADAAEYADGRVSLVCRQLGEAYGVDISKLSDCKNMILAKIMRNGERFENITFSGKNYWEQDMFPEGTDEDGLFKSRSNPGWIAGFYTGLNYICYGWSGEQRYIDHAHRVFDTLEYFLYNNPKQYYHDVGFTFMLSSYEDYLVSGSADSRNAVIYAADLLKARVNEPTGYIAAWQPWNPADTTDSFGQSNKYRMIVDTMCNIPILFTATELTGDDAYKDAAARHAKVTQQYLVRGDFTTPHTFWFNAAGNPVREATHQGAYDASCWARGQSWVINGMAYAYLQTGDESFLQTAKDCADTYFMMTDTDLIPRWDLVYTNNTSKPKDTSAAAITACGLLDIWEATGDEFYKDTAYNIWLVLYDYYSTKDDAAHEGILNEAVGNMPGGTNITVSIIYGDYYFALLTQRFLEM